jgi:YfiR/HmsC-like
VKQADSALRLWLNNSEANFGGGVMRKALKKAAKLNFSILLLLAFTVNISYAQSINKNESKALLVYSFVKYIGWSTYVDQHAIVIGVVDDVEFADDLRRLVNNRQMSGKVILVKDVDISEVSNCQLVYLPKAKGELSGTLASSLKSMQILFVREDPEFKTNDADISIVNPAGLIRSHKFIINRKSIQDKGMKISVDLIGLANMVI